MPYIRYDKSMQLRVYQLIDSIYFACTTVKPQNAEDVCKVASEVISDFDWIVNKYFVNWQRRLIEGAQCIDEIPNLADKEIVTKLLIDEDGADTLAQHIFYFRDRMVRLLPQKVLKEKIALKNLIEYGNVNRGQEKKIFENMKAGEALSLFNRLMNDAHTTQVMILEGILKDIKQEP